MTTRTSTPMSSQEARELIDHKIEAFGIRYVHQWIVFILGIGNAADAVEVLSIGYIVATIEQQITPLEQSLLTAAVFVGMLLGGLIFGYLSDVYGRRSILLLSLGINGVGGFCAGLSWSVESLIVVRVIAGFGIGGSVPTLFALCAEHLPSTRRGFYLTIVASFWMVGAIFTAFLAWLMLRDATTSTSSWRLFAMISSLPAFTCLFLTFMYVPESPRYLVNRGKFQDAMDVMALIEKECPAEEKPMMPQVTTQDDDVGHYLAEVELNPHFFQSFTLLFHPSIVATTTPLLVSWFCLSFGSYGLATWITVLFKRIGLSNPYGNALFYAMANLPGNIGSALLMDRIGRKHVVTISMTLASLSAILFAFESNIESSSTMIVVGLAFSFNAFSISGWNGLDAISVESFPTAMRTSGMGLMASSGRIGSIAAQFVNGYLMGPSEHIPLLLSITSFLMLVGAFASLFIKQETSGMMLQHSLTQIST